MDQNLNTSSMRDHEVNLFSGAFSTSCERVPNSNEVENSQELVSYFEDVCFIAISGKRKSGKDYFANLLRKEIMNRLGKTAAIIHISEPIKRAFAEEQNLDLEKLMSSSEYKEKFRRTMVHWGEVERRKDPTVFCRKSLEYLMQDSPFKPIYLIIADCRRPSDLTFFSSFNREIPLLHLRISASPTTRRSRGWIFFRGIDDAETECALDDAPFDILVINESERTLKLSMNMVIRAISGKPLRRIMTL
ncbi:unnamed protein product [Rodentolepis nana]|uniref:Phosphomevalonate kinase n=1 Tax=Rodentolepis nana TaxID=102285 RepID=A0A0R3TLZ7_RODNA|nr:unnamed protein product [Rodentolepis nana]